MFKTRSGRMFGGTIGVLLLAVGSVAALRGVQKPYVPEVPEFRSWGPADAPAVIVDYSDFQCGGCAAAVEPLKQMKTLYGDKLRVIFKHHPWYFHANARPAAIAADCAGRQGKFWEMHDLLFQRQRVWGPDNNAAQTFAGYAKELGLDAKAFAACVADPASGALVDADLKESAERWVGSTPTFFVNGRRFVGVQQLRRIGTIEIERAIKRAGRS